MESLELVLAHVSLFEGLRPDERARVARAFRVETIAAGERRSFAATVEEARLLVVVRGRLDLAVTAGATVVRSPLRPGDRYGEVALVSEHFRRVELVAHAESLVATMDRTAFHRLIEELPALALPLANELSSELHAADDVVRELLELHAEHLPKEELADAIDERRRVFARRGARIARLSPKALFRALVVRQGSEPPFWILVGFVTALSLARLVVFLILRYHLEKQLFALVPGADPNPMHVHHFNYGLVLVGVSGLAALLPLGRRALRLLALVFGLGCGLVFDEFALLWNLNPEYANPSSLIASGIVAALLVQLVWFRRFWSALIHWLVWAARGAR